MITILTGPAASGKNRISHLYATHHRGRCAVIDVDVVRWMLRQPHIAPWNSEEGRYQHFLGARHTSLLAKSFVSEGFEVLVSDVVNDELAQFYRDELADYDLRIVRLMPTWDETLRRLRERLPTVSEDEARMLYDQQQNLRDFDHTLDNTALSADDAAAWLANL